MWSRGLSRVYSLYTALRVELVKSLPLPDPHPKNSRECEPQSHRSMYAVRYSVATRVPYNLRSVMRRGI